MEAEWHVLTLLKTHVRTSHVSCLAHIFRGVGGAGLGGVGGAVFPSLQPPASSLHLEAVAQRLANMCGCSLRGASLLVLTDGQQQQQTDMALKYELGPNNMLPPPTHIYTHTQPPHILLSLSCLCNLVMYPLIANQHDCITR